VYISLLHMVMLYDYYIKYYMPLLMHHYRQAVSFRDWEKWKKGNGRQIVQSLSTHLVSDSQTSLADMRLGQHMGSFVAPNLPY
jgi:hypothetical protein